MKTRNPFSEQLRQNNIGNQLDQTNHNSPKKNQN